VRRIAAALVAFGLALAPRAGETEAEPLEPEQAFPVHAELLTDKTGRARSVELRFDIRDGYYLYANRFKVEAPGLALGPLAIPAGTIKKDPFVGDTRILRKTTHVRVPFAAPAVAGEYWLAVTAQGCAENRICYAPFTQSARIVVP